MGNELIQSLTEVINTTTRVITRQANDYEKNFFAEFVDKIKSTEKLTGFYVFTNTLSDLQFIYYCKLESIISGNTLVFSIYHLQDAAALIAKAPIPMMQMGVWRRFTAVIATVG